MVCEILGHLPYQYLMVEKNVYLILDLWIQWDNQNSVVFCRVKLAVNNESQEAVAVKIINLERNPQAEECVRKEVDRNTPSVNI